MAAKKPATKKAAAKKPAAKKGCCKKAGSQKSAAKKPAAKKAVAKKPALQEACEKAGIPLTLNMREGYDHSYYFISTFMADHIAWHAARL